MARDVGCLGCNGRWLMGDRPCIFFVTSVSYRFYAFSHLAFVVVMCVRVCVCASECMSMEVTRYLSGYSAFVY